MGILTQILEKILTDCSAVWQEIWTQWCTTLNEVEIPEIHCYNEKERVQRQAESIAEGVCHVLTSLINISPRSGGHSL